MVLLVDFNQRERGDLVPAIMLPDQADALTVGTKVVATDGEGTACEAEVVEVARDKRSVLLSPIRGSWEHGLAPAAVGGRPLRLTAA